MTTENTQSKTKTGIWAKLDTLFDGIITIPVIGIVLKKAFEKIGEVGAEQAEKKLKEALGADTNAAAKDPRDEIIYNVALDTLGATSSIKKTDADNFERKLRLLDSKKAESYVLWIAKIVKEFEKERKETINPPKGSADPRVETKHRDISEGIKHAVAFIESMLAQKTFNKRVAFLQGKNAFSLVSKKPTPTLTPETVIKFAKDNWQHIESEWDAATIELQKVDQRMKKTNKKILIGTTIFIILVAIGCFLIIPQI